MQEFTGQTSWGGRLPDAEEKRPFWGDGLPESRNLPLCLCTWSLESGSQEGLSGRQARDKQDPVTAGDRALT